MTNNSDMCVVAKEYFDDLFQRKDSILAPVLDFIPQNITPEDNTQLTSPFTREEFRVALLTSIFGNFAAMISLKIAVLG